MYNKQLNKQMEESESKLWEIKTIYEKERVDLRAKMSEEKKKCLRNFKDKRRRIQ